MEDSSSYVNGDIGYVSDGSCGDEGVKIDNWKYDGYWGYGWGNKWRHAGSIWRWHWVDLVSKDAW